MSLSRLSVATLAAILLLAASPPVKAGDALCPTLEKILAATHHGFRGVKLGRHGGRVKFALPGMHNCRINEGDWDIYPDVYVCDIAKRKSRNDAAAEMEMRERMVATCLPGWTVKRSINKFNQLPQITLLPPRDKDDPGVDFYIFAAKHHRGFTAAISVDGYAP